MERISPGPDGPLEPNDWASREAPQKRGEPNRSQPASKRRVFELMNPDVVCVRPGMTVREVATLLAERGVSTAPVVDDRGFILGLAAQSDVMKHMAQRVALADEGRFFTDLDEYRELSHIAVDRSRTPIELLMRRRVFTVARDAGVAVAANIMRERGVHRLPVTDRRMLVGVITALDLLRVVEERVA